MAQEEKKFKIGKCGLPEPCITIVMLKVGANVLTIVALHGVSKQF